MHKKNVHIYNEYSLLRLVEISIRRVRSCQTGDGRVAKKKLVCAAHRMENNISNPTSDGDDRLTETSVANDRSRENFRIKKKKMLIDVLGAYRFSE